MWWAGIRLYPSLSIILKIANNVLVQWSLYGYQMLYQETFDWNFVLVYLQVTKKMWSGSQRTYWSFPNWEDIRKVCLEIKNRPPALNRNRNQFTYLKSHFSLNQCWYVGLQDQMRTVVYKAKYFIQKPQKRIAERCLFSSASRLYSLTYCLIRLFIRKSQNSLKLLLRKTWNHHPYCLKIERCWNTILVQGWSDTYLVHCNGRSTKLSYSRLCAFWLRCSKTISKEYPSLKTSAQSKTGYGKIPKSF